MTPPAHCPCPEKQALRAAVQLAAGWFRKHGTLMVLDDDGLRVREAVIAAAGRAPHETTTPEAAYESP